MRNYNNERKNKGGILNTERKRMGNRTNEELRNDVFGGQKQIFEKSKSESWQDKDSPANSDGDIHSTE